MLRENFMKFSLTNDLHRELINILLISLNSSNYFYCYCQNGKKCDLCDLVHFLCSKENLIDGLLPEKFLKLHYSSREKLNLLCDRIFPFFARMDQNFSYALDFFNKEYEWVLTLTEIIDNDKEDVRNNPRLFDKEFLKEHQELY